MNIYTCQISPFRSRVLISMAFDLKLNSDDKRARVACYAYPTSDGEVGFEEVGAEVNRWHATGECDPAPTSFAYDGI